MTEGSAPTRYIVGLIALLVVAGGAIAVARRTPAQQILTGTRPPAAVSGAVTAADAIDTAQAAGAGPAPEPGEASDATPATVAGQAAGAGQAATTASQAKLSPPKSVAASALPVLKALAPAVTPKEWINTPGLAPDDLSGKVVLYEFWTFGCYNCKNVLPYVKAWHARYAKDGLVVLSIHSPEFDYEAKTANVQKFVTENDITYPVALDPDMAIWRSFNNRYWPNMYLHDQVGQRRYEHIGEGAYDETEDAIRGLLGVDATSPRAVRPA